MHIKSPSKKEEKRLLAGMLIGLEEKPDNGFFASFKRKQKQIPRCARNDARKISVFWEFFRTAVRLRGNDEQKQSASVA
jgi:hypothetical protein